jgi:hypothetical protein
VSSEAAEVEWGQMVLAWKIPLRSLESRGQKGEGHFEMREEICSGLFKCCLGCSVEVDWKEGKLLDGNSYTFRDMCTTWTMLLNLGDHSCASAICTFIDLFQVFKLLRAY